MEPEALVLIEDEPEAQKLVVTWPQAWEPAEVVWETIAEGQSPSPGVDVEAWGPHFHKLFVRWSRVSGVDVDDVARWLPILAVNGIIRRDGLVDEDALTFVKGRIVRALTQRR